MHINAFKRHESAATEIEKLRVEASELRSAHSKCGETLDKLVFRNKQIAELGAMMKEQEWKMQQELAAKDEALAAKDEALAPKDRELSRQGSGT